MDDLISRAWVLAEYDRQHKGPPGGARKIMEEAPAVDAVPVVHGWWVECSKYSDGTACRKCSECNDMQVHYKTYYPKYCPNCGAKMDEEV